MTRCCRYRSQGVERTSPDLINIGTAWQARLCINCGIASATTAQLSDWSMGVVLVYNRELSDAEIITTENYLSFTYGVPLQRECSTTLIVYLRVATSIKQWRAAQISGVAVRCVCIQLLTPLPTPC